MLSLKWACYLAVSSINMHDTYLDTQLIVTCIDIIIIKKIKENTYDWAENTKKMHFPLLFFEHQYLAYYNRLTSEIFNTYSQHSHLVKPQIKILRHSSLD